MHTMQSENVFFVAVWILLLNHILKPL